ncbi:MAG: hypothetical protein K8R90_05185 [Candidatus Cloacimonetes bacterium]|nr:hypothetical protein [Candidatus Cloacimonadota bacterium]
MAIDFTTGTGHVETTDVIVHMRETASFTAPTTLAEYDALKDAGGFVEIGAASGFTFDPSEDKVYNSGYYGRRVTKKKAALDFIIDNLSVANIAALETLDGKAVDVLLEEVPVVATAAAVEGSKFWVFLGQIFNFTGEKVNDGEHPTVPVKFEKSAKRISDIRYLGAVPASA